MRSLDNPIQEYAWGSHTVLADFLGRPAPDGRAAGRAVDRRAPRRAVPAGLRRLAGGATSRPTRTRRSGRTPWRAFGPRLPFLLKVLAVAEPLSLQVHPDREQAERGFAAETAPPGDPARNYKDSWPKPELLCALTDFHALCGLRDPREAAELLAAAAEPRRPSPRSSRAATCAAADRDAADLAVRQGGGGRGRLAARPSRTPRWPRATPATWA